MTDPVGDLAEAIRAIKKNEARGAEGEGDWEKYYDALYESLVTFDATADVRRAEREYLEASIEHDAAIDGDSVPTIERLRAKKDAAYRALLSARKAAAQP